jgi:DNA mismatch endonuclease (patch repair protein)
MASGISGWRMHPAEIAGKPDFVFLKKKIAIFVDGCFWHGCRACRNIPRSNRSFWESKIEKNKRRDRKISRRLKKSGWQVLRFWEHDLKKRPTECCRQIQKLLSTHSTRIRKRN